MKRIKTLKRWFLMLLVIAIAGWLLRGPVYRRLIIYKPVKERRGYEATDRQLLNFIKEKYAPKEKATADNIVKQALAITSSLLSYTAEKNETDPNRLIVTKTAHCIGYATFCASVCNYLFKKNRLSGWTARPIAGHLYFGETNIHQYFKSSFFKDHDFVIIENTATGETISIDPTMYEYLLIARITYQK